MIESARWSSALAGLIAPRATGASPGAVGAAVAPATASCAATRAFAIARMVVSGEAAASATSRRSVTAWVGTGGTTIGAALLVDTALTTEAPGGLVLSLVTPRATVGDGAGAAAGTANFCMTVLAVLSELD